MESERSTVRLPASGRPQLLISGPSAGLPRLKHLRRFTCRQGTNVQTAKLTKNQFIPLWNTLKVYAQLLLVVVIMLHTAEINYPDILFLLHFSVQSRIAKTVCIAC